MATRHYLRQFFAMLVAAVLLGQVASSAAAQPMSQEDINTLIRTSVWYTDEPVEAVCTGGGPVMLIGSDNAQKVYNFLVGKGLEPWQAAGVMGNMQIESGILPQRLQYTSSATITPAESAASSSLGWGIVQWTPAGKFINTQSPISQANDLGVQLAFLWEQLEGRGPLPEEEAGRDVKSAPNIEEATYAFMGNTQGGNPSPAGKIYRGFERPAATYQRQTIGDRVAAARGFLAMYGSNAPATGPETTPNPAADPAQSASPCGGGSGGTSIPTGETMALAKQIDDSPNITFQTAFGEAAFKKIVATGRATDCGGPAISAKLLGVILKLSESYKLVLGGFLDGRGSCSDGQHPLGKAIDINGINPLTGPEVTGRRIGDGPGDAKFDPEEQAILTQFYQLAGEILSANGGGGLGEQQCFNGVPPKVPGVIYFNDTCDHIHMDARDV